MKADLFTNFLLEQIPFYDKEILKDIAPTDRWLINPKPTLDVLPVDVRLLPNRLRPLWAFRQRHPRMLLWQIGKRFHLKSKTVQIRLSQAEDCIDDRLKAWIKTLPILRRRRERYARYKTWRLSRKPWTSRSDTFDRFRAVWPNCTKINLTSDWPPPSRLNCVEGKPCDP